MFPTRPPPKEQAQLERYSTGFFSRPDDDVEFRALADKSAAIAAAVERSPPGKYAPGVTALAWLERRLRAQRVANYKVRVRFSGERVWKRKLMRVYCIGCC